MAKLIQEFGKPNKDGKIKVYIILSHHGIRKRVPTSVILVPEDISKDKNGNLKITGKKRIVVNRIINDLEEKIYEYEDSRIGHDYTVDDLFDYITGKENNSIVDFFTFSENWLSNSNIKGKKNYLSMLNSLERYIGARQLPFNAINYQFLSNYANYLREKPRAQSLYLGEIRHIYNEARLSYNTENEIIISPVTFEKFKVPKQQLKGKRAISIDILRRIIAYEGTGRAGLARDCFLLSFCLMGMNSADMYDSDAIIRNGRICYHRKKTRERRTDEAYIEVQILPQVKNLIKKYRGQNRLFDFYRRYADESGFNKALNKGLDKVESDLNKHISEENKHIKDIDKKIPIINNLQFYQARHTWATIARNEVGIDKGTVNDALIHVDPDMRITDLYIKKDFTQVNFANKKVLDFVFQDK